MLNRVSVSWGHWPAKPNESRANNSSVFSAGTATFDPVTLALRAAKRHENHSGKIAAARARRGRIISGAVKAVTLSDPEHA